MKKEVKQEVILVVCFSVVAIAASLSQTIAYRLTTPPGFSYPLVHNYVEDYYYYLHLMRQGFDDAWLATSRYSPEVFAPQLVHPFFLFLGHVGRVAHLSLPALYTLARAAGGMGLVLCTYLLIRKTFLDSLLKRIAALLFVFTGSYVWGWDGSGPTVAPLVHTWTELDPLVRVSYIPHHLWAKVFMVVANLLLVGQTSVSLWRRSILVGLAVTAAGMTSPVVLATLLPTIALWLVAEGVAARPLRGKRWIRLVPWLVALGVGLVVAWYHRVVEVGVFPWNSYKPWEDAMRYPVDPLSYAASFGPSLLLFLLAVPWLFGFAAGRLLLVWGVSGWIMLFGLGRFLPLSNARFLGGYQFIPVGIGAAQGLWMLVGSVRRWRIWKVKAYWVGIALMALYSAFGLWASGRELAGYIGQNRHNPQVFVPNAWIAAFDYLNKTSEPESVVLAPQAVSTMIPALTSHRVVWGHPLMTYQGGEKNAHVRSFYSSGDPAAMQKIMNTYRVEWVLKSQPHLPPVTLQALGLVPAFENSAVILYRRER